jgi:hypothetical protein
MGFFDRMKDRSKRAADDSAEIADDELPYEQDPPALSLVPDPPEIEPDHAAEPAPSLPPGESVFGPAGEVDEDGYSNGQSYAQKAATERAQLVALELRIAAAIAADDHNSVVATKAYADDLRVRIARFDALAGGESPS